MKRALRDRVVSLALGTSEAVLQRTIEIVRLDVRIPELPAALHGFTIAQISDLHVGEGAWRPLHVPLMERELRAARPDLVVNTGDFMHDVPSPLKVGEASSRFVINRPPAADSAINLAIWGNHDFYAGTEAMAMVERHLSDAGVRVLTNEGTCVPRGTSGVSVIGLTDKAPGFERGVEALLAASRPRIVLVHRPEEAERLPRASADLVLAGHTHGGQIALPFLRPWIVRHGCGSHYTMGPYYVRDNPVWINKGLGCVGFPLRFRAAPELTLIRLVPPGEEPPEPE